ncbi:uncharacterized protein LOC122650548 [Telopea speciosissima]|uniref:uncharacterized protein LOC122650548 n=1 Tax=Telopea speciosissima TaxID=54955 RepID=UPI001CC3BD7A|nr:uncharacterized protein LOC122650548 [Telopea speciosissima]
MCETAKKIWDTLVVSYERTSHVKESKIDKFVHKYELFKMLENENIANMFLRFTNIINKLKGFGKTYTKSKNVRKILRSLSPKWRPKITAIKEAKDLGKVSINELLGSLLTHEVELNEDEKYTETKESKKKFIALKMTNISDDESEEEDNVGHFKIECPKIGEKKKAYAAENSWDSREEEQEEESDDEQSNLTLMTLTQEKEENNNEITSEYITTSKYSDLCDDIDTDNIDENDIEKRFEALYKANQRLEITKINLENGVVAFRDKVDEFILNTKEKYGKFDEKSDEGIFLGYSFNSCAYRVFNKRSLVVEESINVKFDISPPKENYRPLDNDDKDLLIEINKKFENTFLDESQTQDLPREVIPVKDHLLKQILENLDIGVQTRSTIQNTCNFAAFISTIEPINIKEALNDNDWILAMQEELYQFERNDV